MNWRRAPLETRHIVDDAGATVLFVGAEFLGELDDIESDLTTVSTTVVVGDGGDGRTDMADFMASGSDTDPGVVAGPDDVCLQLYTSGATGLPRGVMLSNHNLFAFIEEVPTNWKFTPDSVSHVVMPTFHIAGSGWGLVSLAMGARMILDREVDPSAILREVEGHRITHAIHVPAVLAFLQIVPNASDHEVSSMRLIAYGASPITCPGVADVARRQRSDRRVQTEPGLSDRGGARGAPRWTTDPTMVSVPNPTERRMVSLTHNACPIDVPQPALWGGVSTSSPVDTTLLVLSTLRAVGHSSAASGRGLEEGASCADKGHAD